MADLDPRFQKKIVADKAAEGYADAALVDRAERYDAELDSPEVVDDDRLNLGVIVVVLAVLIVVYAVAWLILTTPIISAPTDEPAQSPAASAIHIRPAGLAT